MSSYSGEHNRTLFIVKRVFGHKGEFVKQLMRSGDIVVLSMEGVSELQGKWPEGVTLRVVKEDAEAAGIECSDMIVKMEELVELIFSCRKVVIW